MKKLYFLMWIITPGLFLPSSGIAQNATTQTDSLRKGALKFFIDCNSCDMNYTREEIPYVNYVRDTREAEVYLLITYQSAGSGGQQYTLTFQGQGKYNGMNDTLVYTSNPDETSSIVREKKTNLIKMGLMRYVARTPVFSQIKISNDSELKQEEVVDKWNNWVFELRTSPRFNAEQSYRRLYFANSINISRVTPEFKLEIEADQSNNKQQFIYDDVTTEYIRRQRSMDILLVKSLGSHWSSGLKWDFGSSTSENYDFNTQFLPSVEYDIFPYSEATHRQFRILYSAGYQYSNYIDTTIYNKTKDNLFLQELNVAYQVQEKWGSINVSLSGSTYFNDFSKNKLELFCFTRLRIIKGLSLSVDAGIAYINDQLNLSGSDLSEAERLLRLKEQATNFSVEGGLSLTYTFGSIYNNVVNPRFGNGGGGGYY